MTQTRRRAERDYEIQYKKNMFEILRFVGTLCLPPQSRPFHYVYRDDVVSAESDTEIADLGISFFLSFSLYNR